MTDDGYIAVYCMEPAGKSSFKSPEREDVRKYSTYDILCQIDAPTPINQRRHYCLSKEDNEIVQYAVDHYH